MMLPKGEYLEWESRKITKEVMQKYGVIAPYFPGSDAIRNAVVFPYYEGTKVIGTKTRDLDEEKRTGKKKVYTEGHHNLFGLNVSPKNADTICIVGGEVDVLSVATLFPQWCVVGLPGDSTAASLITKNQTFIRSFKKILIAMDNDEAGKKAEVTCVSLLPAHRTHVVSLTLNDPNDYLVTGQERVLKQELTNTKPIGVSPFITSSDIPDYVSEEDEDKQESLTTGFTKLDLLLGGGLHSTEFLGIVGTTGIGKSAFVGQVAYNLAMLNDTKVGFFCSEMDYNQMLTRLGQVHLGKHYRAIENGKVVKNVTKREIIATHKLLADRVLFSQQSVTDPQELYDYAVSGILEHGLGVVVVDVVNDLDGFNSDWKLAANTMLTLKKLADGDVANNVPPISVILVCHTKGDDTETVSINSVRGGSTIKQRLTSMIAIEGERGSEPRTLTMLKYSRNYDLGFREKVQLTYDTNTTRYAESNTGTMEGQDLRQSSGTVSTPKRTLADTPSKTTATLYQENKAEELPVIDSIVGQQDFLTPTSEVSVSEVHTRLPDKEGDILRSEGQNDNTRHEQDSNGVSAEPNDTASDDANTTETYDPNVYKPGHPTLPKPGTPEFFTYLAAKEERLKQEREQLRTSAVVLDERREVPTVLPNIPSSETVLEAPKLSMRERNRLRLKALSEASKSLLET